jgi:hypothetical protein
MVAYQRGTISLSAKLDRSLTLENGPDGCPIRRCQANLYSLSLHARNTLHRTRPIVMTAHTPDSAVNFVGSGAW